MRSELSAAESAAPLYLVVGSWVWSTRHDGPVRVLEAIDLWDRRGVVAWDPSSRKVARLAMDEVRPLSGHGPSDVDELVWRAAAARVADALCRGMLLAPLEGTVIPLPHQLRALQRAVSSPHVRFLLADEVGLGKTIEAGLILREMKLRGRLRRTLVLAPKGLVFQWVQEMGTRFDEPFHLVFPADLQVLRRTGIHDNPWTQIHQVVCPLDAFKPLERRQGWTREQIATYNRERSGLLLEAGWDLIVVDEAHRLGGSTEDVARHRFGELIAKASPHLLLLSATPHQGKTDSFLRLMRLLDASAFPDGVTHIARRVAPYLVRTEKRAAVDADGMPLFKRRSTRLCPVGWRADQADQKSLYNAVTEYVREGYDQAIRERRFAVGFLMILMQRLVTSSTRAIRTAMERRLASLEEVRETPLFGALPSFEEGEMEDAPDPEADPQDAMDNLVTLNVRRQGERDEVRQLLLFARRVEAAGTDAKAQALLDLMRGLRLAEDSPGLKFLVFTEFIPTQEMLAEFLTSHGFAVTCLNGTMGIEERRDAQTEFAQRAQVLVSTDAGGEGLNLQFCHVVVNYDLPWNPMRIEQRIGRVDRIGQEHEVTAINLVFADTVEHRVREVLEEKLATILAEFGVDKTSDVLESVEAGAEFDRLYADVVVDPARAEARVEKLVQDFRERVVALRSQARVLDAAGEASTLLDPAAARQVLNHPLPGWIEILVLRHLTALGGTWSEENEIHTLVWPDGTRQRGVFSPADAVRMGVPLLSIQDDRIRDLALGFPAWVPGQPIPEVHWSGLVAGVVGTFGIFRITLIRENGGDGYDAQDQRILPIFVHTDGRRLAPTARYLWDRLLIEPPKRIAVATGTVDTAGALWDAARDLGREVFQELSPARSSIGHDLPGLDLLFAMHIRQEVAP